MNAKASVPDSEFCRFLIVGRLTENGTLAVNEEKVFSHMEAGYKIHRKIKDDVELWEILKTEFGLSVE